MHSELVVYFAKFFAALFAILNPIGALPVFVSLSQGRSEEEIKGIPRRTAAAVASILIVSAFFGKHILSFFGVGIPAFRIAGGILILTIALAMVRAKQPRSKYTPKEATESAEREDVAVVPLAIPLLAGPGSISTVILNAQSATRFAHMLIMVAVILLLGASIFVLFKVGAPIAKRLGKTGINIFTRIMGLMLAAISMEFITDGIAEIFPLLKLSLGAE
ncbi:MAG: NAAT family transporter [Candidatus Coatesbacteria bacterium]|nr:NAAT family transporter [Candidatus Coatesbacteria bacterium]